MWTLRAPEDSETGSLTFRILPGSIKTIGRAIGADFILEAALVSRVHCRLTSTDDGGSLEVQDLQSTNGTYVNDRRVERLALAVGDRLRVGRIEMLVERI